MATTADNVRVAVSGGVYVAPVGTALVTNATAALDAAFDELGYITEDGLQETVDQSVTTLRAWQNNDSVRHIEDSHDLMYELAVMESNAVSLLEWFGNYAANTGAGTEAATHSAGLLPFRSWVFNIVDGSTVGRLVIPKGRITARADRTFSNGGAVTYGMTIDCFPDATGAKAYQYGLIPA